MPAKTFVDEVARSWEEEGLFARDLNGQLIRAEEATVKEYTQFVTVSIDGEQISVPRATPATDSQGNIIFLDASGRTQPRKTTILDARNELQKKHWKQPRPESGHAAPAKEPCEHLIPTVCHLAHMRPAGVCRVCSVAVAKRDDSGRISVQDKLSPACVQPVQPGMLVYTLDCPIDEMDIADAKERDIARGARQRVRTNVRTLLELLASDHLPQEQPAVASRSELNDLERLVDRLQQKGLNINRTRLSPRKPLGYAVDKSSPLIEVDHNSCILCDRCVRSCSDIKENFVIGRSGKGYTARIAFDLNDAMGKSSCVECGECALSCPTNALTFTKPPEEPQWWLEQVGGVNSITGERYRGIPGKSAVTPESLEGHRYLGKLSYRQRQWFQHSIVRWKLKAGDELCIKGEYGFTAYLLENGRFEGWRNDPRYIQPETAAKPGVLSGIWSMLGLSGASAARPKNAELGPPDFECGADEVILGEMTLISHKERGATLRAKTDAEVYEIRRNVLYALQRHPDVREELDQVYRGRALRDVLEFVPDRVGRNVTNRIFAELNPSQLDACRVFLDQACREFVTPGGKRKVDLIRVEPGQIICRQDELAEDFFMIRLGNVKVTQTIAGEERVVNYFRSKHSFGEIACIAGWDWLARDLPQLAGANRRTATCAALDDVELVRIDKQAFRDLLLHVEALRNLVLERAQHLRARGSQPVAKTPVPVTAAVRSTMTAPAGYQQPAAETAALPSSNTPILREFTEQGLYNAQRLLVLDLEACTRCDECTKACSDTHDGVTRLIREGLRFDKWLVASSCRSCTDPYCLVGCPVDAIHRNGERLEIQIENHCIGCGLCAKNCPYGNINMHEQHSRKASVSQKATTCDLCHDIVGPHGTVSCVYACPHNAAFRMSGPQLLARIEGYRPV